MDGQKNEQKTDKRTDRQNYTNFERNLAMMMMVIYDPVKFEFDWTNHFRVRARTDGWTEKRTNNGQKDKQTDGITPISKGI